MLPPKKVGIGPGIFLRFQCSCFVLITKYRISATEINSNSISANMVHENVNKSGYEPRVLMLFI